MSKNRRYQTLVVSAGRGSPQTYFLLDPFPLPFSFQFQLQWPGSFLSISLHIEESRRFVYAQKLARPTAPCYNNEWLVRLISRGYPSTSLHQADPTYFNCPSATTNPTHRPIPLSTEAISSSLTLDRSGSYQARPNYPRAEGRKKPNVTGAWDASPG
ncbi:unnamed protein product [Vicia faba]|uniref:Uncharacterized protein n=1 Tax=Vicia faba TaxID=3906 RepID=A0AAV0Z937_VICFA|nr:unnamed protein product [Vicia faba]